MARRPIRIQRFARDRFGATLRNRQPPEGNPTAANARARSPAPGAASGLGRVSWLEPESGLNPRNSETRLGLNLKAEFGRIFRGSKLTPKILKF